MKTVSASSLRFILWAGFLSATGLLVGITAWTALSEAEARRVAGERTVQSIARIIEENLARTFDSSEQTLFDLTDTIVDRGGISRIGEPALHELLRRRIRRAPNALALFVYDPAGAAVASSYRSPVTPRSEIPPYVAIHLKGSSLGTVISPIIRGAESGLQIIPMTRALAQSNGKLGGVIGLSLDPRYFEELYRSMDLGPRVITITGENGATMARFPGPIDAQPPQVLQLSASRVHAVGAFVAESSLDGADYVCAFREVEHRPVRISVCTPAASFSALWWPAGRHHVIITAVALLVASALFLLILRQLARLERSEAEKRITKFTLDHVSDMVVWIDADGGFPFANPTALRVLGYSAGEMKALRVPDIFTGYDAARFKTAWERLKQRGHTSIESTIRAAGGVLIPIEVSSNFIEYGGAEYNCAVMRDISTRIAAENALRESESRLKTIFDNAPVAIVISTVEDGRILYVNQVTSTLNGFSVEEMIGRTAQDLRFWESDGERSQRYVDLFGGGPPFQFEKAFGRKDGSRGVALASVALTELEGTRRVITIIQDITLMREQETLLRESEARFAALFDMSPIAVVISGLDDGRASAVNPAFEEAFGFGREEIIGRSSLEIGITVDRPAREQRMALLRSIGRDGPDQVAVRGKSGKIFHMLTSSFVIELSGQQRVVTFFQDISERIRMEEDMRRFNEVLERRVAERTAELARANRELESFSYSVSHDLRSPLRGIDGFSALLVERYGAVLGPQGQGYLDRVRRAATRMGKLIDDLLDLARVGRHELKREQVDISALALGIAEELRLFDTEHLREITVAPGLTAVADASLIRIALDNLLRNAWKFTSHTAQPRIQVGAMGEAEPVFFIRDNGAGFDMRYSARLFGPFQRLHDTQEFDGTGIGLAIVRRIVQRHGGEIWAEGAVDRGATFYFTLPAAKS